MGRYAETTEVSADPSLGQIQAILKAHGGIKVQLRRGETQVTINEAILNRLNTKLQSVEEQVGRMKQSILTGEYTEVFDVLDDFEKAATELTKDGKHAWELWNTAQYFGATE